MKDRDDDLNRESAQPDDLQGRGEDDVADAEAFETDEADEEQYDANEGLTGEVGSEGGSPGETVKTRSGGGEAPIPPGSEATETWNPEEAHSQTVHRTGDLDQPIKRNP